MLPPHLSIRVCVCVAFVSARWRRLHFHTSVRRMCRHASSERRGPVRRLPSSVLLISLLAAVLATSGFTVARSSPQLLVFDAPASDVRRPAARPPLANSAARWQWMAGESPPPHAAAQAVPRMATGQTMFVRTTRPNKRRPYDVPQIECPRAEDGMERLSCPSTDRYGRYRCIDDHMLCDGYTQCPGGEDEDRQQCMFYKMTKTHLNVLADALLRWMRGR